MFCSKCGGKIEEGAKFCAKCGTAVNTSSIPNTPPPTMAFGIVKNDIRAGNHEGSDVGASSMENIAKRNKSMGNTHDQVDQTGRQDQPKTSEPLKKKSKLLLIAIIITPLLLVGFFLSSVEAYNTSRNRYKLIYEQALENATDEQREKIEDINNQAIKELQWDLLVTYGIGLLVLAIPTILTIIGDRKKKRKMILAAGIVYIFTIIGIPSAVLCFIAFAKMKKLE